MRRFFAAVLALLLLTLPIRAEELTPPPPEESVFQNGAFSGPQTIPPSVPPPSVPAEAWVPGVLSALRLGIQLCLLPLGPGACASPALHGCAGGAVPGAS